MLRRTFLKRNSPLKRAPFRRIDSIAVADVDTRTIYELQRRNRTTTGTLDSNGMRRPAPVETDRDIEEVIDPDVTYSPYFAVEPPHRKVPRRMIVNAKRNLSRSDQKQMRGTHKSKYARRERAWDYMEWVKAQPCLLLPYGGCGGVVEADHAGDRGLGQKSKDAECIPLCTCHHRDRTDMTGHFKNWQAPMMREWRHHAVAITQEQARLSGVEIPDC